MRRPASDFRQPQVDEFPGALHLLKDLHLPSHRSPCYIPSDEIENWGATRLEAARYSRLRFARPNSQF
jgi:hypothetical protein